MISTTTDPVQEIVKFAREHSPYYRKHYADLPQDGFDLKDVPLLDHSSFWAANAGLPPENQVLTSPLTDGAVFRTGGTTAVPKSSYLSRQELREGAQCFSTCLTRAGLQPGDRVANLLYGGDLYKGFVELYLALMDAQIPLFQLPIGVASLESQSWAVQNYAATVLVAMPTIMCRLADHLVKLGKQVLSIRLLLYLGELLHKDQKVLLTRAFPSAQIGPYLYGAVDAGVIGLPDYPPGGIDQCTTSYTVNTSSVIMELISDTGEVITTEGVKGNVVVTNLKRRCMPVIRYPMGDIAEWVDYNSRSFHLRGRGAVGVRIGPTSYDMTSLKEIVSNSLKDEIVSGFQVLLKRINETVFRIACQPRNRERSSRKVQEEMGKVHEQWKKQVEDGLISPLVIEWVAVEDLEFNTRSGKLKEIIDLRVV